MKSDTAVYSFLIRDTSFLNKKVRDYLEQKQAASMLSFPHQWFAQQHPPGITHRVFINREGSEIMHFSDGEIHLFVTSPCKEL